MGEGRLINLAAGQGHPAEIMDLSFSLQALTAEHLALYGRDLAPGVYPVPPEIDLLVARAALEPMGIGIDELTPGQKHYLSEWKEGT